jgi:hypothetical protein
VDTVGPARRRKGSWNFSSKDPFFFIAQIGQAVSVQDIIMPSLESHPDACIQSANT